MLGTCRRTPGRVVPSGHAAVLPEHVSTVSEKLDHALGQALARWIDGARRHAIGVLAIAVLSAVALAAYTVATIGFNTDTDDMISKDLPFQRAVADYDRAFPQFLDSLVVVIDGATPDLAEDAATTLAKRLEADTTMFKTVYRPGGDPFFERNGLLYLGVDELEDLADNLAAVQPLLAALARDPSLRGLFDELRLAVEESAGGRAADFDLADAFDRLSDAAEAALDGRRHYLSWHEVISGETATIADRRRIIVVQPRLDFSQLQPQKDALDAVRAAARDAGLVPENGVRVRLTGSVAINYDQLDLARRGVEIAAPVSFILVAIVLIVGLRSFRLVAASLATLLIGLAWTAGFATLVVGELNLISIAFVVLFIGLGIDFSIHLCLRYREFVLGGMAHDAALAGAGREVGGALFLCAITTAAGFYVFIPTDYVGVADLGLISGSGMFISLAANVTVLPALLTLMPLRPPATTKPVAGVGWRLGQRLGSATARRVVRVAAVVGGLGAIAVASQMRFDVNPLNLLDPSVESVVTQRDLLAGDGRAPWPLRILAASRDEAVALTERLTALDAVDEVVTIADYLPADQDEKLAIIEEIAFFLGPLPPRRLAAPSDAERRAAMSGLRLALDAWRADDVDRDLAPSVNRLAEALARLDGEAASLGGLERDLLGGFPERLRRLYAALEPVEPIAFDDLPQALVAREVAADGRHRVQVFPTDDIADDGAMRRFIAAVREVAPDAIGHPVSIVESGDAVVRAFRQALASAIVVIVVLLIVITRRFGDAALVAAPLLLAAALTGAATVIFAIPFNFANVIVLPLLLGIGVDSAIHLVHRRRADPTGALLDTSTARAVVFSALTTICSFGSLMLSVHHGTATMGQMLTIGVGFTVLCTLVVLPAVMPRPTAQSGGDGPGDGG